MSKGRALWRKRGVRALAFGAAAATAVAAGAIAAPAPAVADTQKVAEESAAHGHALYASLLGVPLVGGADTVQQFAASNTEGVTGTLDLTVLGALEVDLGGIKLPLITDGSGPGLLNLGDLGAVASYSEALSETRSVASSGIIKADGSVDLGPTGDPDSFAPAKVDLSSLLRQLLGDGLVDTVLSEAAISVGAVGSRAESVNGVASSEYMVSGIGLDVKSPLLGSLVTGVDDILGTLLQPVESLLGPGGGLESIVGGLVNTIGALPLIDAELGALSLDTKPLTDSVRNALLQTPLENAEGSVSIDLGQGTINVDLDELVVDATGAASLSSLPANTQVLDDATINAILDGVTDALLGAGENALLTKVVNIVTEGLYGLELNVAVNVSAVLGLVKAPVEIRSTVGGLLGIDGHDSAVIDVSKLSLLGIPLGNILQPIVDLLTGILGSLGGVLQPVVNGVVGGLQPALQGLVSPIVTALVDPLEPVLSQLAQITINEQPAEGDLGPDSFTVRALSVSVLPLLNDAVKLELGSSTVKSAAEAEIEAGLTATSPVEQGGTITLTGSNFGANEDVTVELRDGTTETVTADANGAFTLDWAVPKAQPLGFMNFTATGVETARCAEAVSEIVKANTGGADNKASTDADADSNVNASASASASADADNNSHAAAQVAAQAAAMDDATSVSSAMASANATAKAEAAAEAAAKIAANANASTNASASADGSAEIAAQAAAQNDATAKTNADASASTDANPAASSKAAATATSSSDASADAALNANAAASASASASASANADDNSNASAQVQAQAAAQAAAMSDSKATSAADAASDITASAAAKAAANATASSEAAADSKTAATASAQIAAQAAAQADNSDDTNASGVAEATANTAASGSVAAIANSSSSASSDAAADVNGSASASSNADVNANASASASASAKADDKSNASAQVAAQAAAMSDASTAASAKADDKANAAAQAAATTDASTAASAKAETDVNASAQVAAQAAAMNDATSEASAQTSAAANANASAAASVAATADSSATASAAAAADSVAAAQGATAQASADASAKGSWLAETGFQNKGLMLAAAIMVLLAGAIVMFEALRRNAKAHA